MCVDSRRNDAGGTAGRELPAPGARGRLARSGDSMSHYTRNKAGLQAPICPLGRRKPLVSQKIYDFMPSKQRKTALSKKRGRKRLPRRDKRISRSGRVALIKPARNGRWVASAPLYCFQLPTLRKGGREACKPRHKRGVPFQRCGFKKKPSRTEQEKVSPPLPRRGSP